jgi:hypothetical protein
MVVVPGDVRLKSATVENVGYLLLLGTHTPETACKLQV